MTNEKPTSQIAGYVITKNEEQNIQRCLTSLLKVTKHIVVLDSESTDTTIQLAQSLGAQCIVNKFENYAAQRNVAIEKTKEIFNPDYIITIDADEWLTDDLVADLNCRIKANALYEYDIYLVHLQILFDNKTLKWGGFQKTWLPRVFRTDIATYGTRVVNEHISISPKVSVQKLKGLLINDDVVSWEDHIAKHNKYSSLEAKERLNLFLGSESKINIKTAIKLPHLRRRFLRQHIWDRLPAKPALRFIQIYIVGLGILDGKAGFHRAIFEAWQEMCTDLKFQKLKELNNKSSLQ